MSRQNLQIIILAFENNIGYNQTPPRLSRYCWATLEARFTHAALPVHTEAPVIDYADTTLHVCVLAISSPSAVSLY